MTMASTLVPAASNLIPGNPFAAMGLPATTVHPPECRGPVLVSTSFVKQTQWAEGVDRLRRAHGSYALVGFHKSGIAFRGFPDREALMRFLGIKHPEDESSYWRPQNAKNEGVFVLPNSVYGALFFYKWSLHASNEQGKPVDQNGPVTHVSFSEAVTWAHLLGFDCLSNGLWEFCSGMQSVRERIEDLVSQIRGINTKLATLRKRESKSLLLSIVGSPEENRSKSELERLTKELASLLKSVKGPVPGMMNNHTCEWVVTDPSQENVCPFGIRGGPPLEDGIDIDISSLLRVTPREPEFHDEGIGFRVCHTPVSRPPSIIPIEHFEFPEIPMPDYEVWERRLSESTMPLLNQ